MSFQYKKLEEFENGKYVKSKWLTFKKDLREVLLGRGTRGKRKRKRNRRNTVEDYVSILNSRPG